MDFSCRVVNFNHQMLRALAGVLPGWGIAMARVAALGLALVSGTAPAATTDLSRSTVLTWMASPQPVWNPGFVLPAMVPEQLQDQTVRQLVRLSVGGSRLRIVLSNTYGKQPLEVGKATLARLQEGGSRGTVTKDSLYTVTFGGKEAATILPGASLISDPVLLTVPALAQLAVSLYLPDVTPVNTFHWDARQTAWIVSGDQTHAPVLRGIRQAITARLLLTEVYVDTDKAPQVVVAMGDSITDGATASMDQNTRWPDFLAARLAPHGIAVVNAGISGARLLSDGMGVNALTRLERDVLAQPGAESLIVLLGINDISWPGTAFAPQAHRPSLDDLTAGYRQLIEQAHSQGVRVIGATLTPFEGALPNTPFTDYYHPDKNALRQKVNDWIRHSGAFDAVIDFDAVLRDPEHPARMHPKFDSGDHLHPGDEGNRAMAEAVDLEVLQAVP